MEFVRYYTGSWSPWERVQTEEKAQVTIDENITLSDTTYNTILFDNLLSVGDAFELSNGSLICKRAGIYIVNAKTCVGGSSLTENDRLILRLMKNSVEQIQTQQDASGTQQSLNINGYMLQCSVNDVISMQIRNYTEASGIVISEQTYLSLHN